MKFFATLLTAVALNTPVLAGPVAKLVENNLEERAPVSVNARTLQNKSTQKVTKLVQFSSSTAALASTMLQPPSGTSRLTLLLPKLKPGRQASRPARAETLTDITTETVSFLTSITVIRLAPCFGNTQSIGLARMRSGRRTRRRIGSLVALLLSALCMLITMAGLCIVA